MQPQLLHVCSNGLYSIRKPRQLLADQLCKNLAPGPGSLHLVPVGGMLEIQQEASNPNFPFRQESVGGLGPSGKVCTLPHSTASCLQLDLPAPPTRPGSTEEVPAPTCSLLQAQRGAEGVEEAALGGLLVLLSWLSCTTTTALSGSASLLLPSQPENAAFELAASLTKVWWVAFCLTSGSISETPGGSGC